MLPAHQPLPPHFLSKMTLDAVPAGKTVLQVYRYLQQVEGQRGTTLTNVPLW
jgi:hypothetical protein